MTDLRYPTARALAWEYGVVSVQRRGIRTAHDFVAGKPWTARYRIAVEGLGGGRG